MDTIDKFESTARAQPDKPAIIWKNETISYRSVHRRVRQMAAYLESLGLERNARIGICLHTEPDFLILMLAAWRFGGAAVPLNFRSRPAEISDAISTFDLDLVLTRESQGISPADRVITADDAWRDEIERQDPDGFQPKSPGEIAFIGLTSGTTGRPRGICTTYEQLDIRRRIYLKRVGQKGAASKGPYLSVLPLAFRGGNAQCTRQLVEGGTIVLMPAMSSAKEMVEAARRERATSALIAPPIVRAMLELDAPGPTLLPDMTWLGNGGGPLTPEEKLAARRRISPAFADCYASGIVGEISVLAGKDMDLHPDSVGRLMPYVTAEIVDQDDRPLPVGEIGFLRLRVDGQPNLVLGGNTASNGGFNDIIRDGWNYPGDMARLDGNGLLYLEGRATDMIVVGGSNVHPQEVDNVLCAHPAVTAAAAVGCPADILGEVVVAFVVAEDAVDKTALFDHCREHLSAYKRPRDIIFVDRLPCNANGKVVRRELKAHLPQEGLFGS